jgi:hypothetical protein
MSATQKNHKAAPVDTSLYDRDFVGWVDQTALALRNRDYAQIDMEHLIEEVESMGRQQQSELTNRLAILLAHLLKWQAQPLQRIVSGRSWSLTIKEQRRQIQRLMDENPSLKPYIPKAMENAYGDAIILASRETSIDETEFSEQCPFSFEQAMQSNWMPG